MFSVSEALETVFLCEYTSEYAMNKNTENNTKIQKMPYKKSGKYKMVINQAVFNIAVLKDAFQLFVKPLFYE